MTENKLTESEIMKVLECCSKMPEKCEECPLLIPGGCGTVNKPEIFLDLINRKNAEIEEKANRLKEVFPIVAEIRNTVRAEAIKEFAERVKKAKTPCIAKNGFIVDVVLWDEFNQIAKEMGVEL